MVAARANAEYAKAKRSREGDESGPVVGRRWTLLLRRALRGRGAESLIAVERVASVLPLNAERPVASVDVEIHLVDANDNSPVFLPSNVYVFQVGESGGGPNRLVGRVQATDPDLGPNGFIKYQIKNASEALAGILLDPISGEIRLANQPTKEKK